MHILYTNRSNGNVQQEEVSFRVYRGGSWYDDPMDIRAGRRNRGVSGLGDDLEFRLATTPYP
jgi:formylglycine-generating enzyme required for sulfatase activity